MASSSSEIERTFLIAGKVYSSKRSRMEPTTLEAILGYRMNRQLFTDDMLREAVRMRARPVGDLVPMHEQNVRRHERLMVEEKIMGDYKGDVYVDNGLDLGEDLEAYKYMDIVD